MKVVQLLPELRLTCCFLSGAGAEGGLQALGPSGVAALEVGGGAAEQARPWQQGPQVPAAATAARVKPRGARGICILPRPGVSHRPMGSHLL